MALLARNADRLYWAARYLERAEDTARLVQEFGELFDDMPDSDMDGIERRWSALLAVCGDPDVVNSAATERDVVAALVTDAEHHGSVVACVAAARANLRTTREVMPREAWRAVNDLSLFVAREAPRADDRRFRGRVLGRVADDSRRLDGILLSSMSRSPAFDMWRMGRYLERADMTTRVVGVRAATLMAHGHNSDRYDEVQWMGVLRSLSALQMYQRATRGPIEATSVVRFLLFDDTFPRSVTFCLDEIDRALDRLTRPERVRSAVESARHALMSTMANTTDGADLDEAMESVQFQIAQVNGAITDRYLSIDGG